MTSPPVPKDGKTESIGGTDISNYHTFRAFLMFCNVDRTTDVRRLNLISSWRNTVFIDSVYSTGNSFITYTQTHTHNLMNRLLLIYSTFSMLKSGGSFESMSVASSSTTCCGDLEPPPEVRGKVSRMLSKSY